MMGRVLVVVILVSALLVGGVIYYLQVYAFYRELPPQAAVTVTRADGMEVPLEVTGFRGIDADSSPIRYRACFTPVAPPEGLAPYPQATPLIAPGWFDCFDAKAIGAALEAGTARAWLAQANLPWGVDRVIAVLADGRAVSWPQINACGREVFEGREAPAGCPPLPAKE